MLASGNHHVKHMQITRWVDLDHDLQQLSAQLPGRSDEQVIATSVMYYKTSLVSYKTGGLSGMGEWSPGVVSATGLQVG